MYSSSRRIALAPVRTRSIGVISLSRVRIGLILSAEPSHAEAGPIRPPRRRYSSVSTANHIFRFARAVSHALDHVLQRPAGLRHARAGQSHQAEAAGRALGVDHRDPVDPLALGELLLGLTRRLDGAGDAARDVHGHDLEALRRRAARTPPGSRRSTAARWSAGGRRCGAVGRNRRSSACPSSRSLAVLPVDVEADEVDAVALDEVRRQVSGGVRDDRDVCTGPFYHVRKAGGRGTATIVMTPIVARSRRSGCRHRNSRRRFSMVTLTDIAASKVKELMNGQSEARRRPARRRSWRRLLGLPVRARVRRAARRRPDLRAPARSASWSTPRASRSWTAPRSTTSRACRAPASR